MSVRPGNFQGYRKLACEGKRKFDTPEAARRAARKPKKARGRARMNEPMTAYKCVACHYWHIGPVR